VSATTFSNRKGSNDGGDPDVVVVNSPPGIAGSVVAIRVETLASLLDGSGYSPVTPAASFTYRQGGKLAIAGRSYGKPVP
jgi:hypothetical protein